MSTYADIDRLLANHVSNGNVAGFVVEDYRNGTETLYAVTKSGIATKRVAKIGVDSFNHHAANWQPAVVPQSAEFIGNYPAL